LLGTLHRQATARAALTGMIAGLATMLFIFRYTRIAFTWYVLIGASVTFVTGLVVTRINRGERVAV
jgi:SSS family solute:Na+ symporter